MRIGILGTGSSAVSCALAVQDELSLSGVRASIEVIDFGLTTKQEKEVSQSSALTSTKRVTEQNAALDIPEEFYCTSNLTGALAGSAAFGGWSTVWGATKFEYPISALGPLSPMVNDLASGFRFLESKLPYLNKRTENRAVHRRTPRFLESSIQGANKNSKVSMHASQLFISNLAGQIKDGCNQCGLCLEGCPENHIWSARTTWPKLLKDPRITYTSKIWIERLEEVGSSVLVIGRHIDGNLWTSTFDRVFVGLGALQTAALMIRSNIAANVVKVRDSSTVLFPFVAHNFRKLASYEERIALCEGFVTHQPVRNVESEEFFAQVYGFSPSLDRHLASKHQLYRKLPRILRMTTGTHVAFGMAFFDQTLSGEIQVRRSAESAEGITFSGLEPSVAQRDSQWNLVRRAFHLIGFFTNKQLADFLPVGNGYHLGASFPFSSRTLIDEPGIGTSNTTDDCGRPNQSRRIHLIDSSVLPRLAPFPPTWTVMANATRIARKVIREQARY